MAAAESVSVPEDGSVLIDVLANDTDPDGDKLRVEIADYTTAHGTVLEEADGKLRYTPFPDYHGSDAFTYQATDGVATSSKVMVSISVTPVNDAPMAYHDAFAWGLETDEYGNFTNLPTGLGNGPGYFAGNVLNNDIDFDWQDAITTPIPPPGPPYGPPPPPSGKDTIFAVLDTQPAIGSVANFKGDGTFYYMYPQGNLNENFQAIATSFTYHVEDGKGGKSAPATAMIWVKKGNYGANYESKDVPTFLVGDDPIEGTVGGGYTTVLTKAPSFGRMTAFEFDGKFKYTPRHDRTDQGFGYKLVDPGGITYTFVIAALPMLQMDLYDGQGGAQAIREEDEVTVGAFTVANTNDTDSDYIKDDVDEVVKGTPIAGRNTPHDGVDEVDLMKVVVRRPNMSPVPTLTLEVTGAGLSGSIYDNPYADAQSSGLSYVTVPPPARLNKVTFNDAAFRQGGTGPYNPSITVWVELRTKSAAMRDYQILLTGGGVPDRAKATAVWSALTNVLGDDPAETGSMLMNQESDPALVKYRRSFRHSVGSFPFGTTHGKMGIANPRYTLTVDMVKREYTSNPVEFEFTLTPAGVGKMSRLGFDASRSVEAKSQEKPRLDEQPTPAVMDRQFQANRDRANDDSVNPNGRNLDEYKLEDKYYTVDAPGIWKPEPGMFGPNEDWIYSKLNALEFIRVKIGIGATITDINTPANGIPTPDLQGSRMSELTPWHSWIRIERDGANMIRSPGNTNEVGLGLRDLTT